MSEVRWNIQATVWGGVTGFRQSLLKGEGGEVVSFTDPVAAQTEATRLSKMMNHERAKANFSYVPVMERRREG